MTPCAALRLQIAAYADDELGVDAAILVEGHLDACPTCRRAVARQRHLTRALRELYPQHASPPGLEARVRSAVLGRPALLRDGLAAAALGLAFAGIVGWYGTASRHTPAHTVDGIRTVGAAPSGDSAPVVTAAAAIHRRIDARLLPLEVASGDVSGVNAWLRARLPFAASVAAPGSPAITLEGATVVELDARPAGLVHYRVQGRAVSLFLLAAPAWGADATPVRVDAMDFRVFHRDGLDLVGWSHASLSYLLVSADGLATGDACAVCHGSDGRRVIGDFVRAVAGGASNT